MLHLLRLQKQHGFQIVAVGDDKQCQAISAGAVIDLLRRALGSEAIPEILTTIRQKKERERDIAGLFRQCTPESVAAALDMKREDGTAELVDGDYQDAVERIAELAVERGATISAPTNADALAIGRAVRKRRGISGGKVIKATDGTGAEFDLELAAGDRVRLFAWTNARFESGKVAHIGNNSSVLDVVRVADDGIWLRTREGNTGFVKWDKLRDEGSGRIKLTYGDCLTIDSAQGMTSDEHIHACPAGTAGIDGLKNYVASTRHKIASYLIVSKGAEMQGVRDSRPAGVREPITEADIWARMAKNLSRKTLKENATAFLASVEQERIKTARAFQAGLRPMEARERDGKPQTTVKQRRAYRGLEQSFYAAQPRAVGFNRHAAP